MGHPLCAGASWVLKAHPRTKRTRWSSCRETDVNTGQKDTSRHAGHTGNRGHGAERCELTAGGLSGDMAVIAGGESRLRSGSTQGWGQPRQPRASSLPVRVPEPLEFSALLCHNVPSPNPRTHSSTGQVTTQGNGHRSSGYSRHTDLCAAVFSPKPRCLRPSVHESCPLPSREAQVHSASAHIPPEARPGVKVASPLLGDVRVGSSPQRAPRCPPPHR